MSAGAPTPPIRTIIVDDHRVVREGLRAMLDGIEDVEIVGEAENEAGALASVAEHEPDVVLLDLMMPVMDGFALLRELRREDATRSIPVIAFVNTPG